jgi:hypothetical protein
MKSLRLANRRLGLLILATFAAGLISFGGAVQAKESDPLATLSCVEPDLLSYWGPPSDGEVVVAYSLEGFYADLKRRLPAEVFQSIWDASEDAMQASQVIPNAVGDGQFVQTFYNLLAKKLSALAKLPESACHIQVGNFARILDSYYLVRVTNRKPGSWLSTGRVSELSGSNHELLALIARAGDLDVGVCSIAYQDKSALVRVCK